MILPASDNRSREKSMRQKKLFTPLALPIYFFAGAIFAGAAILASPVSARDAQISFLDALFTATSAACVTGLTVVDTGTAFSPFGQHVILALMQLGGLGIMTYTSLIFYLWRRRVSITDRIAVGQSLLHDPTFSLGAFLTRVAIVVFAIEAFGALALMVLDPVGFTPYSAAFHAVSAFCNAGFSLFPDSLMRYKANLGVNLVFVVLITSGGLGFAVLIEVYRVVRDRIRYRGKASGRPRLSWHARTVLKTSLFLVVAGAVLIYIGEYPEERHGIVFLEKLTTAVFASVTCRTAGFNTLDTGIMADASLLIMILLMFIGGSPGSCAGGVKTTTFRALVSFFNSQIRGRRQTVIGRYALDEGTINKAITLAVFAATIILVAMLILCFTEGAAEPHPEAKGRFLEILFETVSAFGTVGLSTGLTAKLSVIGKCVITALMFIGRLGPILFLSVLQNFQQRPRYSWPEKSMLVG